MTRSTQPALFVMLSALLVLCACSPLDTNQKTAQTSDPDMGVDQVDAARPVLNQQDTVFADGSVWGEKIASQTSLEALVLSDDRDEVLLQTKEGLRVVGEDNVEAQLDSKGALAGKVIGSALKLGREEWLLGTKEAGVIRISGGEVSPTPLDESIRAQTMSRLLTITQPSGDPEGGIWFATKDALLRLENDRLEPVTPADGGAWSISQVVESSAGDGVLWVLSDGALWHLTQGEKVGEWGLEREAFMSNITQIAPGDKGDVWALVDGNVMHRQPAGEWTQLGIEEKVVWIDSHAKTPFVWARLDGGQVRLMNTTAVYEPKGLESLSEQALVTARGRVLDVSGDGVMRWYPGADLRLVGLPASKVIEGVVEVEVSPVFAQRVVGVKVSLDGMEVAMAQQPWKVMLDPGLLGPGAHTLKVEVDYGKGEPYFIQTVPFEVAGVGVGWKPQVEQIYLDYCALCHADAREQDGRTPLKTQQDWQRQMPEILDAIEKGRMPPADPKPTEAQVRLLKLWQESEFP